MGHFPQLGINRGPDGVDALIMQRHVETHEWRHINYTSQVNYPSEKNYSPVKKESLDMTRILSSKMYLYGIPFTIIREH